MEEVNTFGFHCALTVWFRNNGKSRSYLQYLKTYFYDQNEGIVYDNQSQVSKGILNSRKLLIKYLLNEAPSNLVRPKPIFTLFSV